MSCYKINKMCELNVSLETLREQAGGHFPPPQNMWWMSLPFVLLEKENIRDVRSTIQGQTSDIYDGSLWPQNFYSFHHDPLSFKNKSWSYPFLPSNGYPGSRDALSKREGTPLEEPFAPFPQRQQPGSCADYSGWVSVASAMVSKREHQCLS